MWKKTLRLCAVSGLALTLCIALLSCSLQQAVTTTPEVSDVRAGSAYWITRASGLDEPMLAAKSLDELNAEIAARSAGAVQDLRQPFYPKTKQQLTELILSCVSGYDPDHLSVYLGAHPLSREQFFAAVDNCNIDHLPALTRPRYALALRRSDLRGLPQQAGWYYEPQDVNYDNLQVRAVDPGEPMVVLHETADHSYYFVQTFCALGWINVSDVVLVPYRHFSEYVQPEDFVVSIKPKVYLKSGTETVLLQMGARLPVAKILDRDHYVILLPGFEKGRFVQKSLTVSSAVGFKLGFLPLSRQTLIGQAFAYLGYEYGWGGQNDGVDCSTLIRNIFRTTGVILPNNTREMLNVFPRTYRLQRNDVKNLLAEISTEALPGDCLIKNGHIMLYLGTDEDGEPFALHALSSYYPNGQSGAKVYVRKVIVSNLRFKCNSGNPFVESLETVGSLR